MDSMSYEQHYHQHPQQYPQHPYWPQNYIPPTSVSHEQSNYTTSSAPPQVHNFHYDQHSVVPRPMMPPEWGVSIQHQQRGPEQHNQQPHHHHHHHQHTSQQIQPAYIPGDSSTAQYGPLHPAPIRPPATTFLSQARSPIDHEMELSTPRGSHILPCSDSMNQITYYGPIMNNALVPYPAHTTSQPGHFAPNGFVQTSHPHVYLENSPQSNTENNWQFMGYASSRGPYTEVSHPSADPTLGLSLQTQVVHETYPCDASTVASSMSIFDGEQSSRRSSPTPTSTPNHSQPHTHVHVILPNSDMLDPCYTEYSHGAYLQGFSAQPSSAVSSPPSTSSSPDEIPWAAEAKGSSNAKSSKRQGKTSLQLVPIKKEGQATKKIGKRQGPLRPDQRKQAGEIRKLRACIRCRYLKKTCDTGVPCNGCQPHHARLWQVPCTRLSIQDLGYFAKDWKADYERIENSTKFQPIYSDRPVFLWISHGFGKTMRVSACPIQVLDGKELTVAWKEGVHSNRKDFKGCTAHLQALEGAITSALLSQYIDEHINEGFEEFVLDHFEGTRFITEMLITVYNYYCRTNLPVVRKALKLVVAYNLTMHITMVESVQNVANLEGHVQDHDSKNFNKILAPHLVNAEIKRGLASIWRDLMKDVLSELAKLYTSVYSGDKLKNWPTIFMLDSVLLAVWEEMQFDANYLSMDQDANKRFCEEMESTPVGVIVGLFAAISQKLPSFLEWDTNKHHHILNSDVHACTAMSEVREHVKKHAEYLQRRSSCVYDRDDFDSLANKFVSRLVVRAN